MDSHQVSPPSGQNGRISDNRVALSKRQRDEDFSLPASQKPKLAEAEDPPTPPPTQHAAVPGYTALYSTHRPSDATDQDRVILEYQRQRSLDLRPHASTFPSLASITPMDSTMGYDPIYGLRRIQSSQPAQSTTPITSARVRDLARRNLENDELKKDDAEDGSWVGTLELSSLSLKVFPKKTVGTDHQPNPLTQGRIGSWLDIRLAVNTPPSKRTDRQHRQYAWYAQARERLHGVKMPYGMAGHLFDPFTTWENNPGAIPASIRADPNDTLIAEDVWIHTAVRQICTGQLSGPWTARAQHLRLFLLALFQNAEHLWLQMPANAITSHQTEPLPLLDRIRKAEHFEGPIRGEENLLRFSVHLQGSIRLKPWDVRVFGRWATRVMSGLVYNVGARSAKTSALVPKVPEISYSNGIPYLVMPLTVKDRNPEKSGPPPSGVSSKPAQVHQRFDPVRDVGTDVPGNWSSLGRMHDNRHQNYDQE